MTFPEIRPESEMREARIDTEQRRFPGAVRHYGNAAAMFEARGDLHHAWDAGLLAWQLMSEMPEISQSLDYAFVDELFGRFRRCADALTRAAHDGGDPDRAEMFMFSAKRAQQMHEKVQFFHRARGTDDLGFGR